MTRKHFEAIAEIIRAIPEDVSRSTAAHDLADYFETQNPLFDRRRFLIACGL